MDWFSDSDFYMQTTAEYTLYDEDGNELTKKKMVEHIKIYLDEIDPDREKNYRIKSSISVSEFVITKETTQEDWREYSRYCLELLD